MPPKVDANWASAGRPYQGWAGGEDGRLEVVPVRRRRLAEFRGLFPVAQPLEFAEERARAGTARGKRLIAGDTPDNA